MNQNEVSTTEAFADNSRNRKAFEIISAQAATEVENSVVIIQRKIAEELFQFLEAVTDLRRIAFVGFCVGLV